MDRKSLRPYLAATSRRQPAGQQRLIAQHSLSNHAGTRSAANHCAGNLAVKQFVGRHCEGIKAGMTEEELRKKLELLKTEHRDLDAAIAALTEAARNNAAGDQLQIARLKKRKLRLRDQIAIIEDTLLPDIIA
jgi:hypothetical protein